MTTTTNTAPAVGIVLAGTYAWSHSAFDSLMPRALLPIGHRPLISYALSWLHDAGLCNVAICGNRGTRALISSHVRFAPTGSVPAYHEDVTPRGSAGSSRDAAFATEHDTFVVAEGTSIPNVKLAELLASHRESAAAATVVVYNDSRSQGDPGLQVPTGIYVFDRRALESVPARGFFDIKEDLIAQLYRAGERIVAFAADEPCARVMSAATYLAVNGWIVENLVTASSLPLGFEKSGNSLLHRDASIDPGAVFIGPVLVAAGARIGAGVTIVGPSSVGRDATIHEGVMISRSAVWRRSIIGPGAAADRSILADDAVVEAGVRAYGMVVNRRHVPSATIRKRYGQAVASPLHSPWSQAWQRSTAGLLRTVGVAR